MSDRISLRIGRHHGDEIIRENDLRNPHEMDYARLIHSSAFRRLQGKSQVFTAGTGDYYRTRLTHSLEVAQIARHAAQMMHTKNKDFFEEKDHPALYIDPRVVECAALAHDFGHPPFGHKGEQVLNDIINANIVEDTDFYFEGNPQNFRILTFLEKKADFDGLNLTNAVLLSINKYPYIGNRDRTKGLYKKEWSILSNIRESWGMPIGKATLEAQLMDICDDIAYSTHDIEDGIKSGKIGIKSLLDEGTIEGIINELNADDPLWSGINIKTFVEELLQRYVNIWNEQFEICFKEHSRTRREVKGYWVNRFVTNLGIIEHGDWYKVTFINRDNNENEEIAREILVLKKLAWTKLINDFRVQRLQKRSERILQGLWEAFIDPRKGKALLPKDWVKRQMYLKEQWEWKDMVLDYISGMTDAYAEKVYSDLYGYGTNGASIYGVD